VAHELDGKKIAIIAADMVERVELTAPREALEEAGAQTELISIKPGEVRSFNHFDPAESFPVERTAGQVRADDYDAVYIPGGVGNPDQLRADRKVVRFVQDAYRSGKPIGAMCHGPWVLVEAGLASGRRLASWPTLQTDIRNAGGEWTDREVVHDGQFLTSRGPADLPAYTRALVEHFAAGGGARAAAS
jgi:protease I